MNERGLDKPNLWGKRVRIAPNALPGSRGQADRMINVSCDPNGPPQSFAIDVSATIDPLLGAPQYDVRIGIGEENYEWRNLPAPPAGSCYVVRCHTLTVDCRAVFLPLGTEAIGWACPTHAAPTLTP